MMKIAVMVILNILSVVLGDNLPVEYVQNKSNEIIENKQQYLRDIINIFDRALLNISILSDYAKDHGIKATETEISDRVDVFSACPETHRN